MARRTASAASISSWEFKLGWLDSSNTVAVVSHKAEYDAGDAGDVGVAVCDAPSVVANGSKDSKGEVHVVGSPGITPQSGNSKGEIDALCWLN